MRGQSIEWNRIIEFDLGYLRKLETKHIHAGYINGLNDPEINSFLEVRKQKQSSRLIEEFIRQNNSSKASVLLGIWSRTSKNHIGTIRIHDISLVNAHCYLGICIFDKAFHGLGYGNKSLIALHEYLSNTCNGMTIEAHVHQNNIASQRLFRKSGYTSAGIIYKKFPGDAIEAGYYVYRVKP